jgi:hypothetical protein
MPVILATEVKPTKSSPDSIMEIVRKKDTYLFDEIAIKNIAHDGVLGVAITYDYTRHGATIRDLQPLHVTDDNFAQARVACGGDTSKFAQTELVQRIFADGARQFNQRDQVAKADFLPDQDFIAALKADNK